MAFSLLTPLRQLPLVFIDTETTGVSTDFGHRVIEVGLVRVENGQVSAEYAQLIDPQRPISAGVTALTSIAQSMVAGQPRFVDQMPRLLELMRGAILLGHNIRFDLSFLSSEFRRAGCQIADVLGADTMVMDTVRIARRRYGRGGNALQLLARRLGVMPVEAHRALADAHTTRLVFDRLMASAGGWDCPLCDALAQQGGVMGLLPSASAISRQSLLPLELEEALEMRRPVMMEYVDARQQRTHRVIQPLHVRRSNGELLLVAHCQMRQAQRTFKLDRIVRLMRLENGAEAPLPADGNEQT